MDDELLDFVLAQTMATRTALTLVMLKIEDLSDDKLLITRMHAEGLKDLKKASVQGLPPERQQPIRDAAARYYSRMFHLPDADDEPL